MLVHKGGQIKNWSGECRDIIPTKLQCQAIQRVLQSPNLQREIIHKKNITFFFLFSPINFLIILYQLTKFEAPSCYSFRDIINTNFQSPNLQREIIKKKKKKLFFRFSPINLLIILYQLTKFEAPSCYSFRDIMNTNFQGPNLQREIIKKKYNNFFLNFHQLIYSSSSIS